MHLKLKNPPNATHIIMLIIIIFLLFRETRGRIRGSSLGVPGMAGVLARMAAHRKGETPPPPYDSPPPYHVAIKMSSVPDVVVSDPVVI